MAIYTIGTPDGRKLRIEAPDEATAIRGAQEFMASQEQGQPQSAYEQSLARASQMSQFAPGQDTAAPALPPQQPSRPDLMGSTAATLGGIVNAIPIIGPMSQSISDNLVGLGAQLTGGDYAEARDAAVARREALAAANPIANIAGNIGGSIGSFGALGATSQGARALGMDPTRPIMERIVNSGLSTTGLTTVDNMVRGQAPTEALGNALTPGGISAAIPALGAAGRATTQALGERIAPMVQSALDPISEAARRVGVAVGRDVRANPQAVMNSADEAVARQTGMPLINVDRGGETTRALARSVANQSPEARAVIQRTVEDRFSAQAPRAVTFIQRLVGGNADDIAYRQSITDAARIANKPRYQAAFNNPKAQQVFTVETQELMQSPAIQRAIDMTQERGKDFAAIAGEMPVVNPFRKGSDGRWRVVQLANGTFTAPSLAFWDQVKRNLDGMIGVAQRSGDKTETSVLMQIKDKLVGSLDRAVPQYKTARQGAAAFFDAEDALDAGRIFANQPKNIPEARQAFSQFNAAEKQAFATGYASELIDRIKVPGNSQNIIKRMFDSTAAREMNELVFGKAKAAQLEAFVKVEMLADQLRGAMGNSTTARQLMEMGIGGAAGGIYTQDWTGVLTGAALARGGRYLGEKVDAKVMQEVARLLTSDSPEALQKAVYNAALSPKWMLALDALSETLAPVSRGLAANPAGRDVSNNNAQPLRVTVQGAGSYGAARN